MPVSAPTIFSKGANFMTIAQQNQRLLALVIFFALLAILLLAVVWFEGSQLLNGFWHTVHGIADAGTDVMSHRP
jgi:Trk-type K+ transport system membrane component